jgi:cytochrome c oxidase subunit 4
MQPSITNSAGLRPCTRAWLALLALTTITYAIGQARMHGITAVFIVLAMALVKTHWVAERFMGLRHAGWPWRAAMAAWQLAVAAGLAIAYLKTVSP